MSNFHDPGYGDPRAPVGSAEWAKRWRLEFQNVAKNLPHTPRGAVRFFEVGQQHRAWTLLADADGRPFVDFDAFCACPQPYGLGMEPAKFCAYLAAEMGDKAADLVTVAPGRQGERTDRETSHRDGAKSKGSKDDRLRAILRAPEVVQQMYRAGQMTQADAARMGPARPTPDQAAALAEARQELERLDRAGKPAQVRKAAGRIVRSVCGVKERSPLDWLRRWWGKAAPEERATFLAEVTA